MHDGLGGEAKNPESPVSELNMGLTWSFSGRVLVSVRPDLTDLISIAV